MGPDGRLKEPVNHSILRTRRNAGGKGYDNFCNEKTVRQIRPKMFIPPEHVKKIKNPQDKT
jgi:hypothetical protein